MNNLLQLKGTFEQKSRRQEGFGAPNLPKDQYIEVKKLVFLV